MCRTVNINLGIDFDNTLVNYDNVIYQKALQLRLITPDMERNKKNIRDRIRKLPDGEIKWQELQAFIYGKGMTDSQLFEGVKPFLDACRDAEINVSIISHKTQFASLDEERINLRDTAIFWMKSNRFFDDDGLGLSLDKVYFESTRQEKIERIKQVGCTHFIDDLEETFLEPSFPANVEMILYTNGRSQLKGVKTFTTWKKIHDYFFTG